MMLIIKNIFRCMQLCCGQYMTILDLVTCLGGGKRVIILVTLAMMNHIQKLWKVLGSVYQLVSHVLGVMH